MVGYDSYIKASRQDAEAGRSSRVIMKPAQAGTARRSRGAPMVRQIMEAAITYAQCQ
jgi:hypothetical protein